MNMETSLVLAPLGLMLHPQAMVRERERQADPDCLVLSPRRADDKLLNAKSKLPIDIQTVQPCSSLKRMIHDRAPASEPRPAAVWGSFSSGDDEGTAVGRREHAAASELHAAPPYQFSGDGLVAPYIDVWC
ncbi:hypothetical protein CSIM01_12209 [Colletotrichum simmondsii]|uniref:Uncharacterized protein n=1 Tax=Colletotrichum simmondsii TaxID=703756 RepID=A0A135RXT0_9PEZI|nr:hypothetical protein CSIM01_12209 [Colletotrichum simmondsii]